ncbi:MAG TPA: DUF664 domain-containing protein [Jiangellaceae bacterium]|jgi:hypothetical protein|nr:DUF664 domain-containing protein [Jiangellaceae bacterium]
MAKRLAKPPQALGDTKLLFLAYLDQYRSIIADKLAGLSDNDLRNSRLPSGWTPIELLKHLVFMDAAGSDGALRPNRSMRRGVTTATAFERRRGTSVRTNASRI